MLTGLYTARNNSASFNVRILPQLSITARPEVSRTVIQDRSGYAVAVNPKGLTGARKEWRIVKLTTVTMVSIDGVLQGLGRPDEDTRGGFERGGWVGPLFDAETGTALQQLYQRADGFLFGRFTYEIFANHWAQIKDEDDPVATSLNSRPKYVASTTLTEAKWADTTILSGDVAATLREMKAEKEGELQVHGSGELVRSLLANDLVDEIVLFVCPIVLGQGTRLFADNGPDIVFELVESQANPKGVTVQTYRPAGRPTYVSAE